ncbi:MAG: hypothetical protein HND57_15210 [Planctomycetes bacterium]|nr:hypothetical protein [Planctomycetota bacterium]
MPRLIGYHWVKSCYGQWFPGDERGHWSEAWDEQIGYIEPHILHPGDPMRRRMAEERTKHPPAVLDNTMIRVVADTIANCSTASDWNVAAIAIEPTHVHLAMTQTARDVNKTVKWLAYQTAKSIHRLTSHTGPVWCKGRWLEFIDDASHWENLNRYINEHNERRYGTPHPFHFVIQ